MSSTGDKVILSEKIFKENPNYPRTALIDMLSDLLEAELVLIPWDRYEEYGHSDGMVRYIGEGRVLLNNYFDFDKYLRKRLINALTPHFDVSELHYGTFTKNSWAYINFLHVGKHVFVPMLSEKVMILLFVRLPTLFHILNVILSVVANLLLRMVEYLTAQSGMCIIAQIDSYNCHICRISSLEKKFFYKK